MNHWIIVSFLNATSQTNWTWDSYGIVFQTPSDFKVTTDNSEEFSAENDNVFLTLTPWKDATVTKQNLADALKSIVKDMEYDDMSELDKVDSNDFTGYAVYGKKDGVKAIIATLLNKKSGTNLIVIIVFIDGYEKTAKKIAMSIGVKKS